MTSDERAAIARDARIWRKTGNHTIAGRLINRRIPALLDAVEQFEKSHALLWETAKRQRERIEELEAEMRRIGAMP